MIPGKQYTPEMVFSIIWRHKWAILVPAVLISVAVAAVTYRLPARYKSDTLILVVPQRVPETYVRSTVTTRIEDRLQSISQQILSRTRLERIIQDFNLYADVRKTSIMEDVVEQMRLNDIKIEIVKGDAFRVSYIGDDPRTAMRVTERLSSLFIDESLRDREVLAEGTDQFLEAQLEDARRRLIDNEKKLEEYRRQHDGQLPTQLEANMQGLHNAEMQVQSLLESINRDHDRRLMLERAVADANDALTATVSQRPSQDDAPLSAADQLKAAQEQLRALELRLKPEHPDVVRAKRTIAELEKRAESEASTRPVSAQSPAEAMRRRRYEDLKAELESLDRQIAQKTDDEKRLRGIMAEYQKHIEAVPTRESELAELTRDYDTLQQTYKALLVKKQDSQISANLERRQIGEQFKILDPARLPEKPFSPNRPRLYTIGVVAGIVFGFGFAGLIEYFDRTLRTEEDIRIAFNLPVLATIPFVKPRALNGRRSMIAATASGTAAILVMVVAWTLLR